MDKKYSLKEYFYVEKIIRGKRVGIMSCNPLTLHAFLGDLEYVKKELCLYRRIQFLWSENVIKWLSAYMKRCGLMPAHDSIKSCLDIKELDIVLVMEEDEDYNLSNSIQEPIEYANFYKHILLHGILTPVDAAILGEEPEVFKWLLQQKISLDYKSIDTEDCINKCQNKEILEYIENEERYRCFLNIDFIPESKSPLLHTELLTKDFQEKVLKNLQNAKEQDMEVLKKNFKKIKKQYETKGLMFEVECLGQILIEYYAGEREDKDAVEAILPNLNLVYPVKCTRKEEFNTYMIPITNNPEIFRMLLRSKKLILSPTEKYNAERKKEGVTYEIYQNLFAQLVFMGKKDLLEVFMEELYVPEWVLPENEYDLIGKYLETTEKIIVLHNKNRIEIAEEHPLAIAFALEDIEMSELLIEHKIPAVREIFRERFSLRSVKFVKHFLDKDSRYMKYLNIDNMVKNANYQLLEFYISQFGMEQTMEEFIKIIETISFDISLPGKTLYAIYSMEQYCEEGILRDKLEQLKFIFFEKVKQQMEGILPSETIGTNRMLPYLMEYSCQHNWQLPEKFWNKLLEIYLIGICDTDEDNVLFKESVIIEKTRELLVEHQNHTYQISKKLYSYITIQPFRRLLTSFDPKKQNTIRMKQDKQLTFMESVLYMNSIVLIKKAREKGFLTRENMEDAVQFAITHKKEKILPYLLEWSVEKDACRGGERYKL